VHPFCNLQSALIFRLRCISIARKKSYLYVKNFNTWQLCGFFFNLSLKYNSYFHNILCFYKHWCSNFFFNSFLNYVLFLLCVCLIYQSWMYVLLMMPHVGPMIRQ
jgi:hypothetical protein